MTVSYQSDVASSTSGGLVRLLWRWRGSVWKLVWGELFAFLIAYIALSASYDFLFTEWQRRVYEKVVIVCSAFVDMIPLSFILGFYVSFTAQRWWHQYTAIPWPDKLMNNIAMYIPGGDEDSRILRRTLMRYLNLTLVLVLRSISIAVKRRFPTKEHLVEAGFMTRPELEMFSAVPATEFNTFWIPCTWFVNLLRDARQECRITDSSGLKLIMEEFNEYRSKCGLLWSYDWVSIPLVYTQVVTLSTYAFFVASVFGRQHINPPTYPDLFLTEIEHRGEFYIPVFTILQFLLYMGLLKLGEQLINPFGDDDEDFELNWIIDRHIKVSFLGVDILNGNPPPVMKDTYFDEMDIKLPYTAAAVSYKKKTYRGSMAAYHVPSEQQGLVVPDYEDDDDQADQDYSQQNLLNVPGKQSRDSLWSKRRMRYSSASIGTLDSDTDAVFEVERASDGYPSSSSLLPGTGDDNCDGEDIEDTNQIAEGKAIAPDIRGRDRRDSINVTKKRVMPPVPTNSPSGSTSPQGTTGGNELQPPAPTLVAPFDPTMGFFTSILSQGPLSTFRKSSTSSVVKQSTITGEQTTTGAAGKERGTSPDDTRTSRASSSSRILLPSSMPKMPKAAILKLRKADPKLTIRPFRSKVTFSEDTKGQYATDQSKSIYHVPIAKPSRGMRQEGVDLTISSPELSEADLLSAYIEHRDHKSSPTTKSPPLSPLARVVGGGGSRNLLATKGISPSNSPIEEARKTSLTDDGQQTFPTELITAIGLPSEYWLRHQSLPNIQEIGEEGSPTSSSPTGRVSRMSFRKQPALSEQSSTGPEKRSSIKRQKAEDKSSPPKEVLESESLPPPRQILTRKGSAEERRRRYSSANSSSTSVGSVATLPPTTRRYRKRIQQAPRISPSPTTAVGNRKQSSTESEGSYSTAKSFYIQISEEDGDEADVSNNSSKLKPGRDKPSLLELKKSSQSTSSSVTSYVSARDVFMTATTQTSIDDNSLHVPSILVVKPTPSPEGSVGGKSADDIEAVREDESPPEGEVRSEDSGSTRCE